MTDGVLVMSGKQHREKRIASARAEEDKTAQEGLHVKYSGELPYAGTFVFV